MQFSRGKLVSIIDPFECADLTIYRPEAELRETHEPTLHDGQPVACARGRATGCPQRAHRVLVIDDTTGLQYRGAFPFMGYLTVWEPQRRVSYHPARFDTRVHIAGWHSQLIVPTHWVIKFRMCWISMALCDQSEQSL